MSPRFAALAQLLAAMWLSTLLGVLAKWSLFEVAPFTFVWLQLACALPALAAYTFLWRGERLPKGLAARVWIQIVALGAVNFAAVRIFMMLSLEKLPATTHAYLGSFVGIATMGLSVVWLRERPSRLQLVGALLAVAGIRVFFREIPEADTWVGFFYVALVVVGLAVSNNLTRSLMLETDGRLSSAMLTTLAIGVGGIPLVCAGFTSDWPPPVVDAAHWGVVVASGILGIGLVYVIFNAALRELRSFEASVLAGSGILWTALFAYPILGERLVAHQWLGIAMMLTGQGLAQIRTALESRER
jgi:drug/metabolite transporter (DMT)-like permease